MTLKGRLLAHLLQLALLTSFTDARTIRYTFDVSYLSGNPDGVWTTTILGINGQFPGPPIEGEVGDFLEVNVINNIQDGQNVTIHWHGIHQRLEIRTHTYKELMINLQSQRDLILFYIGAHLSKMGQHKSHNAPLKKGLIKFTHFPFYNKELSGSYFFIQPGKVIF